MGYLWVPQRIPNQTVSVLKPIDPMLQVEHPSMATLDAPAAASEARTAAPIETAGVPTGNGSDVWDRMA